MKRLIFLALVLLMMLLPACSADDPLPEDVYTKNIYPSANVTYGLGSPDLTFLKGYFSDLYSDNITLGGAPLLIPAYGEIYNTAQLIVECAVPFAYYLVSGNTTTGEISGFADNGLGRLTYTDITPNRICLVQTALAVFVPPEDRPAIISSKIYLNGKADEASYVAESEYLSDADPADALPIMCLLEMNPGDYIEIYLASATANATVSVYTMTMVATTVD